MIKIQEADIPQLNARLVRRIELTGGGVDIEYKPNVGFESCILDATCIHVDPDEIIEAREKMVPQTGAVSGWAFSGATEGVELAIPDAAFERVFADYKRELESVSDAELVEMFWDGKVPINAALGPPTFTAGATSVATAITLLHEQPDVNARWKEAMRLGGNLSLIGWRFGSKIRKVLQYYSYGSRPHEVEAIRTRVVHGMSWLTAYVLTPWVALLTRAKHASAVGEPQEIKARTGLMASDWTRFDLNPTKAALSKVCGVVWRLCNYLASRLNLRSELPSEEVFYDLWLNAGDIMIAPPIAGHHHPVLITGSAGLRSGHKGTAVIGSIFNHAVHTWIMDEMGEQFRFWNFGDDGVVQQLNTTSPVATPDFLERFFTITEEQKLPLKWDYPTWLQYRFTGRGWRPKFARRIASLLYPESQREDDVRLISICAKLLDVPDNVRAIWLEVGLARELNIDPAIFRDPMRYIILLSQRTRVPGDVYFQLERMGYEELVQRAQLRYSETLEWAQSIVGVKSSQSQAKTRAAFTPPVIRRLGRPTQLYLEA